MRKGKGKKKEVQTNSCWTGQWDDDMSKAWKRQVWQATPRDILKTFTGKRWAKKHEVGELKARGRFEPVRALLKRKQKKNTAGRRMQHKQGRGSSVERGREKDFMKTNWADSKRCKCCQAEGTEKHGLYHCQEGRKCGRSMEKTGVGSYVVDESQAPAGAVFCQRAWDNGPKSAGPEDGGGRMISMKDTCAEDIKKDYPREGEFGIQSGKSM